MKLTALALITLGIFSMNTVHAQSAAKGKTLYSRCISCHGDNGEGKKSMNAPRIAGQYDWYIYSSLVQFKTGERKNPDMLPFIKGLNDSDFKDLAAYISTL
ncbi:c-type cytochrome [Halobacteriovorax sp. GFR7]|uniref:c-type cytochrome n=1 Tax=unclassified Halobacteriovorax TaxID=2639665 RepID=UPI00371FC596